MKTRILLSLLITFSAWGPIAAQSVTDLQQVTLYWHPPKVFDSEKTDISRSSINFETGKRGGFGEYDLTYGGLVIGKPHKHGKPSEFLFDWLRVLDCRSMIVDLGATRWQDFKETPPFPQPKTLEAPRPLGRPICAVDASAGRKDFSPYRQFVEAAPGHVYLMRFLRGRRVRFVMFRVESLISQDNCVLSWKVVKPPNVYDDEK
jgi:hypothetical protein